MYAVKQGVVSSFRVSTDVDDDNFGIPASSVSKRAVSPYIGGLYLIVGVLAVSLIGIFIWFQLYNQPVGVTQPGNPPTSEAPKWRQNKNLSIPRVNFGLATLDGMIYIFGGKSSGGVTNSAERYNPDLDVWESLAAKPTGVEDVSAAVVGGRIFVPGGKLPSGQVTNILEIYNPREDQWTRGKDLPEPISGYAIVSYEGKLYLFGGWNGKSFLSSVYEYDPDVDQWNRKSDMSRGRAYASAIAVGSKIYLIGGLDGTEALDLNQVYSPDLDDGTSDPWAEEVRLPTPRYGMGFANLTGVVYLVGGLDTKGHYEQGIHSYNVQIGEWKEIDIPIDKDWTEFGVIGLGPNIFAMGGLKDGRLTGNHLSYQVLNIIVLPFIK